MNLRRLLLITILAPSVFVIGVVLFSYLPHRAGLLTHGGEHVFLGLVMVTGIIPFPFFAHHIFRRIQEHILQQNKEIGEGLFISESTAKYHLRNILDKLPLENRAQVAAYATRRGLDRSENIRGRP